MKKLSLGIALTTFLIGLSLAGCKKNGTSPSGNSQLAFQLHADNASITPGNATTLTWTSATASVGLFKLEAVKNGTEIEIKSHNAGTVDLFVLTSIPADITLAAGTYTHVEVKAQLQNAGNTVPFKLTGTFTSGATVTPVEFDLTDNTELKLEAENVTVSDTEDYVSLLQMHLDKLLTGITDADLKAATLTDGTLLITSSSNVAIYNKITANLAVSGEHEFEHHHHNGNDGNDDHGHD